MKTKMNYYIAESMNVENKMFAYDLVKRCESLDGAQDYLRLKMREWRDEGLTVRSTRELDELWGAMAMDNDYVVVHSYNIFATPIFMAGGAEGL